MLTKNRKKWWKRTLKIMLFHIARPKPKDEGRKKTNSKKYGKFHEDRKQANETKCVAFLLLFTNFMFFVRFFCEAYFRDVEIHFEQVQFGSILLCTWNKWIKTQSREISSSFLVWLVFSAHFEWRNRKEEKKKIIKTETETRFVIMALVKHKICDEQRTTPHHSIPRKPI